MADAPKTNVLILPGAANDLPPMPPNWPQISTMLKRDGFYVVGDSTAPGANIPIVVQGGNAFSLTIDKQLNPMRFTATAVFSGPFYVGSSVDEGDGDES